MPSHITSPSSPPPPPWSFVPEPIQDMLSKRTILKTSWAADGGPRSNRELTIDNQPDIRKQNTFEEAEKHYPENKEWTMTVLKLAEGLWLTETGIIVCEDIDSNEQRAKTTRHWNMWTPACNKKFLKEKNMPAFLQGISGKRTSPPVLLDVEIIR
jgi:hypothetical protein